MKINPTFTGLHNLRTSSDHCAIRGNYISPLSGKEVYGDVNEYVVRLNFDVSDNQSGHDLDSLFKFATKYGEKYINKPNYKNVTLKMQLQQICERGKNFIISRFSINGHPVPIETRRDLFAAEYIAKTSRKLFQDESFSQEDRENAEFVNTTMAKMAEYFIDNVL